MDTAQWFAGLLFLAGAMSKLVWDNWVKNTPKVIWNGGWTTTHGEIETAVGNYAILRPGIKAFGIYLPLPGALVFPEDGYLSVNPNIMIACKMMRSTIDRMPRAVRSWLMDNKVKGPYWLGYATPDQYDDDVVDKDGKVIAKKPKIGFLIEEKIATDEENAQLRSRMARYRMDEEQTVEWANRITGKKKGPLEGIFTED